MVSFWVFALVGVLVAALVYYPSPTPSEKLQRWLKTGKFYNYEGYKIYYRDDRSKEEGQVLVCLHGFPTMSYDWIKVWPALQGKFSRVITLDLLGLGFSDKPKDIPFTINMQADIVEKLLSDLGVKQTHILAHDMGDSVAQELLARYNERESNDLVELLSVCLTNGGIFPGKYFPRWGQKLLLSPLGPVAARLSNFYFFKIAMSEIFGPDTKPDTEELSDFYAGMLYNTGHLAQPLIVDYLRQRMDNKDRWVGSLQKTTIPVHVIYGNADPINPPLFTDLWKKTVSPDSITVLKDGVGHYPVWEDPTGTIRAYFDFLKNKVSL